MLRATLAQRTLILAAGPVLVGGLALRSVAAPPGAAAPEYTVTPLVKSTPGGMQVTGAGALAGDGSVVFGGDTQLSAGPPDPTTVRHGVYRLRNGAVTPLYETTTENQILRIAANARGDVAFYATRLVESNNFVTQTETIYRIPAGGGAPAVVATDVNRKYDTLRSYPVPLLLGENGRVVFPATLPDTVPPATSWQALYGIFDGPDPAANRVIPNDSPIGLPQLQSIRRDGTVLVRGAGGAAPMGIYSGTDPQRDLVMNLSRYNSPSGYVENARGDAAFTAFVLDGQGGGTSGVYTGPDPVLHLLADSSGPFAEFDTRPHVADDGTVIFSALLDDGRRGIFTGPDPVADRIVASGDALFGSTVTFARTYLGESSAGALGPAGAVLFHYALANGERGLALATPVPEPAAASVLVLGAATLLRRRRKAATN